jgi:hypothetical protein
MQLNRRWIYILEEYHLFYKMDKSRYLDELLTYIPDDFIDQIDEPRKRGIDSEVASSTRLLYHMLPQNDADSDAGDRRLDALATAKDIEEEFGMTNRTAGDRLDQLVADGILTKTGHKAEGYTFSSDHWQDLADMSTSYDIAVDGGTPSTTYPFAPTGETDSFDSLTIPQGQSDDDPHDQATQLLDRSRGMPLTSLSVIVAVGGAFFFTSASPVVLLVSACLVFLMASVAEMLESPTVVFDTIISGRSATA